MLPRAIGGIARILHLSEFMTAFILVSVATSIPELFIGISSITQNIPIVSLGNIFGANLANLTLVLGVAVLFAGKIKGGGKISSRNFWLIFALAFLPVILFIDGVLTRADGIILIVAFVLYIVKIFKDKEYFHRAINGVKDSLDLRSASHVFKHLSRFMFGVILLIASSFALIWAAREIIDVYFSARYFFFGTVILALGTTLPELIFAVRYALSGQTGAILGNALGSVVFNSVAIIGIISFLKPIEIQFSKDMFLVLAALFVAFVLFHFFVYTKKEISRKRGLVLLLLYAIFIILSL